MTLLKQNNINYSEKELLSSHSTFKIGGHCDFWVVPADEEELRTVLKYVSNNGIKYLVIGRGSNSLFDDEGFGGVVISTEKLDYSNLDGETVTFGCGHPFTKAAVAASENSLSGLEFAYGIPGYVGGAVYMNAGAYGGEVSQVLTESRYYDIDRDEFGSFKNEEHCFGHRTSIYKSNPNLIIISATFKLTKSDASDIKNLMNDLMSRRRDKQPLEYPSCGSVFKRPEGYFAGKLIEDSNLKGFTIGGAQVSEKHAGFIINKGGATCKDVLNLVSHIQKNVFDNFGVKLECEIIYIK